VSRPAVCRCPSCEGLAPDDDDLDDEDLEAAKRRQDDADDRADDRADAHFDRMRDERDERGPR